ncbi:hypothetical protein V5O48_005991 [Marasmius crinis-equi]|uniref:Alginate lyase domain-containing protein n=1 Tax=Marasmius crinis-equi TaxID=585013 RepID=A0ABR3FKS0_9AGAR
MTLNRLMAQPSSTITESVHQVTTLTTMLAGLLMCSWWPDCNWCSSGGRNHLAHGNEGSDPQPPGADDGEDDLSDGPDDDYSEESINQHVQARRSSLYHELPFRHRIARVRRAATTSSLSSTPSASTQGTVSSDPTLLAMDGTNPLPQAPLGGLPAIPASGTFVTSHSSAERTAGTAPPAQNAVKTKKPSCTPSPASSMPPSATWTTCPYVNRDGKVNPDVRRIKHPGHINNAGQSVLYNSLAYAFTQDSTYSKRVASFVNALLLDRKTKMNPHANYGQIVRGPGAKGSMGSWTGILDMRGLVKLYNGVSILKATNSPDWTPTMDQEFKDWIQAWLNWMTTSQLGKTAGSRPNNHCTFYAYQVAGAQYTVGDFRGAKQTIRNFVGTCFKDQISASGEQPYEAVRTRPYHYRLFNLEALFALAELGQQVGEDIWNAQTKHGATMKKALDHVMSIDPKNEDVGQILPLVATARGVYGDRDGRYTAFLDKNSRDYRSKPYWYYSQPEAFPSGGGGRKRQVVWGRDDVKGAPVAEKDAIPFTCPDIFRLESCVELDIGLCVTCEMLRPFFV